MGTGRYATRRSRWLNAATQSMIAAPPVPVRMIRNVWARDHGPNCWYSMTERIAVQVNKVSQPDVPRPARSRRKEDETMKIRACCYAALVFVLQMDCCWQKTPYRWNERTFPLKGSSPNGDCSSPLSLMSAGAKHLLGRV